MPDLFISHASEDKAEVARPLAKALMARGFEVWYDETTLTIGDNLAREIDRGLAECSYGIVIISPAFLMKSWPMRELDGLAAREVIEDRKRILPVWHSVTKEKSPLSHPLWQRSSRCRPQRGSRGSPQRSHECWS